MEQESMKGGLDEAVAVRLYSSQVDNKQLQSLRGPALVRRNLELYTRTIGKVPGRQNPTHAGLQQA